MHFSKFLTKCAPVRSSLRKKVLKTVSKRREIEPKLKQLVEKLKDRVSLSLLLYVFYISLPSIPWRRLFIAGINTKLGESFGDYIKLACLSFPQQYGRRFCPPFPLQPLPSLPVLTPPRAPIVPPRRDLISNRNGTRLTGTSIHLSRLFSHWRSQGRKVEKKRRILKGMKKKRISVQIVVEWNKQDSKDRTKEHVEFSSGGVSVHILPGSIRLKLNLLILSGKDVVRIPKSTLSPTTQRKIQHRGKKQLFSNGKIRVRIFIMKNDCLANVR